MLFRSAALHESGELTQAVQQRYAGWNGALGQRILGGASLQALSDEVLSRGLDPRPVSGRQERLENLVNRFV